MSKEMFDLNGRVGLVSGAAQGMGRAMALAIARADEGKRADHKRHQQHSGDAGDQRSAAGVGQLSGRQGVLHKSLGGPA